jgi:hypothetical protein
VRLLASGLLLAADAVARGLLDGEAVPRKWACAMHISVEHWDRECSIAVLRRINHSFENHAWLLDFARVFVPSDNQSSGSPPEQLAVISLLGGSGNKLRVEAMSKQKLRYGARICARGALGQPWSWEL